MPSGLGSALTSAYLATRFAERVPGVDFILGEGRPLEAVGFGKSMAIITAFNPFNHAMPPAQNEAANAALLAELTGLGLACSPIDGMDPTGAWVEESYMVFDIPFDQAVGAGDKYGQNAIVWIESRDMIPRLLLLK